MYIATRYLLVRTLSANYLCNYRQTNQFVNINLRTATILLCTYPCKWRRLQVKNIMKKLRSALKAPKGFRVLFTSLAVFRAEAMRCKDAAMERQIVSRYFKNWIFARNQISRSCRFPINVIVYRAHLTKALQPNAKGRGCKNMRISEKYLIRINFDNWSKWHSPFLMRNIDYYHNPSWRSSRV